MLHTATLIAIVALLVALEVPSKAARLIDGKLLRNGSDTGKKLKRGTIGEPKLAPAVRAKLNRAGLPGPKGDPGPQGTTGERGAAGVTLTCPAGTALHELACIELAARPDEDWYDAFDACDTAKRRLVTLAELQTFRFRSDLNAPVVGSEWADGGLSDEGATREAVYLTMNNGIADLGEVTVPYPYRCVAPATVG
jgi:hypothetical protein